MIEYAQSDVEFHRSLVKHLIILNDRFHALEKRVEILEVANRKPEAE